MRLVLAAKVHCREDLDVKEVRQVLFQKALTVTSLIRFIYQSIVFFVKGQVGFRFLSWSNLYVKLEEFLWRSAIIIVCNVVIIIL